MTTNQDYDMIFKQVDEYFKGVLPSEFFAELEQQQQVAEKRINEAAKKVIADAVANGSIVEIK